MAILTQMWGDVTLGAVFWIDHEFFFFFGQIVSAIQAKQEDHPLPEAELMQCIWTGLINSVEWSARPDQHEGLAVKEVTVRIPLPPRLPFLNPNASHCVLFLTEICGSPRAVL